MDRGRPVGAAAHEGVLLEFEQFGAYRIEGLLGRGGMGEVYRAFDTEHDRVVALKVLSEHLAADAGYRERFRREAHLAARLNEPHIVPIHRYGEIEGRLFLDMRLVPGHDIAEVLAREGPFDPARAVSIIGQAARALDSAHADGLVHRDVKPSNILLTGEGDDEFVYLVDFGIARSTTDAAGPALTQTGAALGSFDYMAPERFLEKPADKRVDVYALACVLFELLTGRRPFTGDGLAVLMYAHLNTEPPTASSVRPELPPALDAVIVTGLAKDPDARYASAGELAHAAREALRDSGVTPAPEARTPAAPPTTVTPLPARPQTVGFSNPGPPGSYGPPSQPSGYGARSQPGGYGPASNPGYLPAAGTGGYGSPSQPGGYGPPSSPGQSTFGGAGYGPPSSPGMPGGYGPASSPGMPQYVPPGGPPYPPGAGKPNRLPLIIAAAAAAVVLVVVLAIVLVTRDSGGRGTIATGSRTTTTTTSSPVTSTPPTTPSAEDDLRDILPGAFDAGSCTTLQSPGDGDLAALDCGASSIEPGPSDSAFYLYEARTVDSIFLADMQQVGLTELASDTNCPDAEGYQNYSIAGQHAGRLACYVRSNDNTSVLLWTQEDRDVEGFVILAGGGPEGLVTLVDWWLQRGNSDFN